MLALYQNGERLRPEQGYPMQLLLPGFEGNMNVKWVTSLWVTDRPPHTKDESGEYTELLADGRALKFTFGMAVKSVITHPSATMTMQGPGYYEVSGLAWSGGGRVARVEVSAELMSRASDGTGAVQPARPEWKAKYAPTNFTHYNAVQAWGIDQEGAVSNVYS